MEKIAGVDVGQEAPMKKIAFASFVGTAMEFYDFYIYGTADLFSGRCSSRSSPRRRLPWRR